MFDYMNASVFRFSSICLLVLWLLSACAEQGNKSSDYYDPGDAPSHGQDIQAGKYGLSMPDSMTVGQSEDITLLIAMGLSDSTLREAVLGDVPAASQAGWQVLTENIKVGNRMRAKLLDVSDPANPAFQIQSFTSETQYVALLAGESTTWKWEVRPLLAGEHQLRLLIEILYGSEQTPRSVEVEKRTISIKASSGTQALDQFPSSIPPWLWAVGGVVVLLGGGGFWFWRQKTTPAKGNDLSPDANFVQKARFFIEQGELPKALDLLKVEMESRLEVEEIPEDEEVYNTLLLQLSRLNQSQKNVNLGIKQEEDLDQTKAKVTYAVLQLLDELEADMKTS